MLELKKLTPEELNNTFNERISGGHKHAIIEGISQHNDILSEHEWGHNEDGTPKALLDFIRCVVKDTIVACGGNTDELPTDKLVERTSQITNAHIRYNQIPHASLTF